ncbi:enolase 4 isoform X2 [Canis lupus familiaris]|uniref:enolase 4 isoform X2 n=1 Tax=Canis lupus familiaris TaxID=9615 RepID=UPI0006B3E927|nr:enolase 4 isoform X2 [Canis lupus familiaris]XP_038296627.1 enolase 4 isoform X2 [Canis lupus familiaris]XP_038434834.1 enolase 4 isoform X2 [Canis lupus familiaris]|eukprot:XP_013964491.1 enolase 4 isoform X3 [Canis lupus familiaris]
MGEEGGGRSFGTARELQKLKQQAMEYYRENDVPRRLEELLNSTFYLQPADVYGHLNVCSVVISTHFEVHENISPELAEAEQVERLAAVSTAVQWVNGTITEELWGMVPSHQAEVDQVLRTFFENKVQEDKERRELEKSLEDPTAPIPLPLPPPPPPPQPPAKKKGQKQGRNDTVTEKPILPPEPAEPVLSGSMAIGAVSLAVAKTSAILGNNPLYLNIALLKQQEQPAKLTVPLLMVSLVSCGKASPGKLNLMKELMCIPHPGLTAKQGVEMLLEIQKHINKTIEMTPPPKTETRKGHNGSKRGQQPITGKMSHLGCLTINYDTIEQPLLLIQGICANLGLDMGTNLHLAINCAAHELMDYNKGKYEVMTGIHKNTAEMLDLYVDLINKFPSIIALIDPFRKEDSEQWESIYNTLGSRCYIIAGAASKSISQLLEGGNNSTPKSSGVIIKHTNQTTVSDLVEVTNLLDSKQHITVFGSTEGESSDDSLVDLAIGLGVRFIKLGGLSRGERVTKYNRLFTIEEELVQNGTLGCNEGHTFFSLNDEVETGTKASKAVAPVTGELPELPEPVFPTELMEASANA